MTVEDQLNRGPKIPMHVLLYENERDIIDAICRRYRCSRAEVIGAWAREYQNTDLTGKVQPGRRPGAGRTPSKGK